MIRESRINSPLARDRGTLVAALAAVLDREARVRCAFLFGFRAN